MRYSVVVKKLSSGFGASVPGLPGVEAVAPTRTGVKEMIREAIKIRTLSSLESEQSSPKRSTADETR